MKETMKILGFALLFGLAVGMIVFGVSGIIKLVTDPEPSATIGADEAQIHNMSAPDDEHVEGYMDSTDIGFATVLYYEINTPDGSVPCLVVEPIIRNGAIPTLDCDWTVIRP